MPERARFANDKITGSMKIFRMGLDGGKPLETQVRVRPEWLYKEVGTFVVLPEADLPMPAFALAGGEEAESVGRYLFGQNGDPWRLRYTIGNDSSDQATEAINCLYLAHSKLRSCSVGRKLLVGSLPDDMRGQRQHRV